MALIDPNPGFPSCFVVFGVSWWTDSFGEEGAGGPGLNGRGLFVACGELRGPGWDMHGIQNQARLSFTSLLVELHPNLVLGALLRCVTVFIRLSGLLPPG